MSRGESSELLSKLATHHPSCMQQCHLSFLRFFSCPRSRPPRNLSQRAFYVHKFQLRRLHYMYRPEIEISALLSSSNKTHFVPTSEQRAATPTHATRRPQHRGDHTEKAHAACNEIGRRDCSSHNRKAFNSFCGVVGEHLPGISDCAVAD